MQDRVSLLVACNQRELTQGSCSCSFVDGQVSRSSSPQCCMVITKKVLGICLHIVSGRCKCSHLIPAHSFYSTSSRWSEAALLPTFLSLILDGTTRTKLELVQPASFRHKPKTEIYCVHQKFTSSVLKYTCEKVCWV